MIDREHQLGSLPDGQLTSRRRQVATKGRRRRILLLGLSTICIIGLAGADRWFYEGVSLKLNTLSPLDYDWYHHTRAFWNLARFWPHIAGGACCYFIFFAFARRGFRKANAALFAVLIVALVAHGLQCAIGRARPNHAESALTFVGFLEAGLTAKGVGLPSGEVATATALSLVVGFVFRRLRSVAWIPTILVILARVLPGMHYISDAAAGALLGLLLTQHAYLRAIRGASRLPIRGNPRTRHREIPDVST